MKQNLEEISRSFPSSSKPDALIYEDLLDAKDVVIPPDYKLPPGPKKLNSSQEEAISLALRNQITLIQGPPGTGKTFVSSMLVYHLSQIMKNNQKEFPLKKNKILVCAFTNLGVDNLCAKINELGLDVTRLLAQSRGSEDSIVKQLSLKNKVAKLAEKTNEKLRAKGIDDQIDIGNMDKESYNTLAK